MWPQTTIATWLIARAQPTQMAHCAPNTSSACRAPCFCLLLMWGMSFPSSLPAQNPPIFKPSPPTPPPTKCQHLPPASHFLSSKLAVISASSEFPWHLLSVFWTNHSIYCDTDLCVSLLDNKQGPYVIPHEVFHMLTPSMKPEPSKQ